MSMDRKMKQHMRMVLDHLWGPTGSVILHILLLIVLVRYVVFDTADRAHEVEVVMQEVEEVDLEEIERELDELLEPPEVVERVQVPDVTVDHEVPDVDPQETDVIDQEFDTALDVEDIESSLVLLGFQTRTGEGRAQALREHAGRRIGERTEAAVIKALEWLRRNQNPDGSWTPYPAASTGLGLLTFLAHGETTSSERYGPTIERAIKYLVDIQRDDGLIVTGGHRAYTHGITAYAISEAYGLTRIPALKPVMDRAIQAIVDGQQRGGGWDYNYAKGARRDTSVSGWQVQALKAAYLAGAEVDGMREAMDLSLEDLRASQSQETGRFGYSTTVGQGSDAITGIGVLCMQLLGRGDGPSARAGLVALRDHECDWINNDLGWPIYAWYYITQAKFHQGGSTWRSWNNQFAMQFVDNQNPDGSWSAPGLPTEEGQDPREDSYGTPYLTTLAALTLQVYYRFLPTYQEIAIEPVRIEADEEVEVQIF